MSDGLEYDDTVEGAPVVAPTTRAVNAEQAKAVRESSAFKNARKRFRDEGSRQRNPDGSKGAPCGICQGNINYRLSAPHPQSWSLDHVKTVRDFPALQMDPLNWQHAHLTCNQVRGTDDMPIDIGIPSELW